MGLGAVYMYINNRHLLSSQYADKIFTSELNAKMFMGMLSSTATLKGVCISANSTTKSKFFSCSWMLHMKRTLLKNQVSNAAVHNSMSILYLLIHSSCFGPHRALWQLSLGNICHPLEVVVAALKKTGDFDC